MGFSAKSARFLRNYDVIPCINYLTYRQKSQQFQGILVLEHTLIKVVHRKIIEKEMQNTKNGFRYD